MLAAAPLPRRAPRRLGPHPRQRPGPARGGEPPRQPRLHRQGRATDRAVIHRPAPASSPTPSTPTRPSAASPPLRETGRVDVPGVGPSPRPRQGRGLRLRPPSPAMPTAWSEGFDAAGNLHLTGTYYSIGGGFCPYRAPAPHRGDQGRRRQVTRPHPSPQPPRCRHGRDRRSLDRRYEARQRDRRRPPPARRRPRLPLA